MNIFKEVSTIFKNLFGIADDCWVKRINTSPLDIEKCEGQAIRDASTNTCELCVALNKTIFWNSNKPEYYHPNCRCKNIRTELKDITFDFPMRKITNYLFFDENKYAMMRSMGYDIQNAEEVYNLIEHNVRKEFLNKNYALKLLDKYGQRIEINYVIYGEKGHNCKKYIVHTGCVVWPNGKIKIATPLILDKEIK